MTNTATTPDRFTLGDAVDRIIRTTAVLLGILAVCSLAYRFHVDALSGWQAVAYTVRMVWGIVCDLVTLPFRYIVGVIR